ncbi:glycosyltransferase [Vibrio parahaemolyticus]|nr:glycosyltransferase [Vibrio parahaemolyticus]
MRICHVVTIILGGGELIAEDINDGVLLGHLNICHNTFLVSNETYDLIGPYNEELRIISDAVWIRKAYKFGCKFVHVNEALFTLSDGGLSSGSTESHRLMFISEVVKSYIIQFPFLSIKEAEEIYLFRFNNKRLENVLNIASKYAYYEEFFNALRLYVEYCFKSRNNFKLSHEESNGTFISYLKAVKILQVDIKSIKINTKHGCLSKVLSGLDNIISKRKQNSKKTILHFASVFSTPSETFIYDLLNRLQDKTEYDNFILFEHQRLSDERPFANKLFVPWGDFRPEVRTAIYKFIFDSLKPDLIIAHFAINEWKLNKRISPLDIKIPTLTMTHGIDVFSLKSEEDYKNYVVGEFSSRQDTHFTAVSDYLYQELHQQGVSKSKITKLSNTASPEFFKYRKESGFYDYSRELKILSIGRCIDWKGHTDLLYGFSWFVENVCQNASLTIVYGNGTDNLSEVQGVIAKLNLQDKVNLEPFVDFSKNKSYFSQFDIYVQASKYTDDKLRKSETFGVAALEAILSGLPIIVTDAGGLPEVAGYESQHSKIVRHRSGIAIGQALADYYNVPDSFSSNLEYAKNRMDYFSEEKQIQGITKVIESLTQKELRVAMFSTSTIQGAGYAAFRLFRGLREHSNVTPSLFTTVRNHENDEGVNVVRHPSGDGRGWQVLQSPENSKPGMTIFTINHFAVTNEQLWDWVKNCDVINIHWTARFLSLENIAFLTNTGIPVVMTIRDMNPITGGCHFFHGCDKWRSDCSHCPQLYDTYDCLPSKVLSAKRDMYNFDNLTLVALSNHTKKILENAPKFQDCRIEVINNSIETDVFKPIDKKEAREILGLPLDRKIIGYVPSFSSEVKGYREIVQAFSILDEKLEHDKPMVMLVGNVTPANDEICLDKQSLGYINDNERLAIAYSAADVVVVPSLEETFSNTTAESISCGTPVVGFKTGAIPDLAEKGVSGLSIAVGDVVGLADGIISILSDPINREKCRKFAEEKLTFPLQAKKYEELFRDLAKTKSYSLDERSSFQPNYHLNALCTIGNLLTKKAIK